MTAFAFGCSDDYDDSALWKDIDGMYKSLNALKTQVSTMQEQLAALNAVVGSGAVTDISQNADGHYVLSYKDAQNVEHRITIATMKEVNTQPIIGMKEDGGVLYWTTTVAGTTSWLLDVDRKKIPVTGRTPEIGVDDNGYWTLFGERLTDAEGRPVKAEGKAASVITGVSVSEDGGTLTLSLGGGTEVRVQIQNGFNIRFIDIEPTTRLTTTDPLVIRYELIGATESSSLTIERVENVSAVLDETAATITVTFPSDFESGGIVVMFYDGADNVILKPLHFLTEAAEPTGILTADDLKAFAAAVNEGRSLTKYTINGEIMLMNDIDMTGVDWSALSIGGIVTPSTATANTSVDYELGEKAFRKVFNGNGHALKNVNWTFNLADGNIAHGLFAAIGAEGEVKNLTIEGTIVVEGTAPQGAAVGAFAGYAEGKLSACVNKAAIAFRGSVAKNISVRMGGIAGVLLNATLTDCRNAGDMTCGEIVNTGNGTNSGFHQGGIAGCMSGTSALETCTNDGALSAPSGRGGGIVAVATAGTLTSCVNNGLIQDDVELIFAPNYNYKRMGGLVGGTSADVTLTACTNNGNVFSMLGCRTGGFVGHNSGKIIGCTNTGIILSDHTSPSGNHGSGWAAGYNQSAELISKCTMGGRVGDYTAWKDHPEQAPEATYATAVVHGGFSPTDNGLNDTQDAYYEWTVAEQTELAAGVTYYHYSFTNINQNVYVVEADLSNPNVVLETVMADEICPNPNANGNNNNGKNLRETLSETCARRRAEGRNILAGVNSGFFNSNDGFPRGFHIEYGEPVFVNNPAVRSQLSNHRPGFTFFEDRTISFDNRSFSGFLKVGDTEYEYYSVNDTIVRLNNTVSGYDANLYTSRFVKEPHPGIANPVGTDALFIVGRNTQPLKVNSGWFDATITAIVDGRNASVEAPFVMEKTDWVLQVTGDKAAALAAALTVGSTVQINATVPIGNQTKSIIMHNASMYRYLNNGRYNNTMSASDELEPYPSTCIGADAAGTLVKIVCVDGTTAKDVGLNYWQLYKVMTKLGMHNAIRFDGGGSTTMWAWRDGAGGVVNTVRDANGERSCMNYMHVRVKE